LAKRDDFLALSQEISFLTQIAGQFAENCRVASKKIKRQADQELLAGDNN